MIAISLTFLTLYYGYVLIAKYPSQFNTDPTETPENTYLADNFPEPDETGTPLPSFEPSESVSPSPTPTPTPTPSATPTPTPEPEKKKSVLPEGFVYLKEYLPDAKFEIRYSTTHNFTGRIVEGYLSDNVSLTRKRQQPLKRPAMILRARVMEYLYMMHTDQKELSTSLLHGQRNPKIILQRKNFILSLKRKNSLTKAILQGAQGTQEVPQLTLLCFTWIQANLWIWEALTIF